MTRISDLVRELGGMAQKQQLVRLGARDRHLTYAVRTKDVIRVRNGMYSTLDSDDPYLRAVRVGGRLTSLSLIRALGGWVEHTPPLHVSLPANASRMRSQHNRFRRFSTADPRGVVLRWEDRELCDRGTITAVAIADALVRVILDEPLDVAVACLDWALHTGRLDESDLRQLIARLPQPLRSIGDWTDAACESLPESLSRTRLRLAGHSVVSQVTLVETGERIDLVVDGVAGIEVDGERFHHDIFERDRRKDLQIIEAHLHPVRPSARMVFAHWPDVLHAIETALADRGCPPSRILRSTVPTSRATTARKAECSGGTPEFPIYRRDDVAEASGVAGVRRRFLRAAPQSVADGSMGDSSDAPPDTGCARPADRPDRARCAGRARPHGGHHQHRVPASLP